MHFSNHSRRIAPAMLLTGLLLKAVIASTALATALVSVTPLNFTAVEGEPRTDVLVATVIDSSGGGGPISATIDWGDGTPVTDGAVVANRFDRFVVQVFQDLLHRTPTSAELSTAVMFNTQGDVANAIIGTSEYRAATVHSLYQKFLRRDADSAGLSVGVNFLIAGGTMEQLSATIVGSNEYFVSSGGTNESFLTKAYLDLLGRPVDSSGLSAFGQALRAGTTRSQVAFSIINSNEGRTVTVQNLYRRFLGRDADAAGLQTFLNLLSQGGTTDQVIAALAGSDEYFQHAGAQAGTYDILGTHTYAAMGVYTVSVTFANGTAGSGSGNGSATVGDAPVMPYGRIVTRQAVFLDRLFLDTLGRPIDPFALESLLPYIEQTGRVAGVRVVQLSEEFAVRKLNEFFNRYLGRIPQKSELDELVPAVRAGGELVVARIVSSDEYFGLHASAGESFIQGLYQDILGRSPTPAEVSGLIGLLRTPNLAAKETNRRRVALKVLRLPETRTALVKGLYTTLLGRQPSSSPRQPGELEHALILLKRGTTWEGLSGMIIGSQEYFSHATAEFAPGSPFTAVLGSFTDANPNSTPADFTASIDWGDGLAASAGVITKFQDVFQVSGSHTYTDAGTYPVTVTLSNGTLIVSQVHVIGECPLDVSDSVTVVRGNAKFDPETHHSTQKVTITNRGTTPIAGPLYLVLNGLPYNLTLANAEGTTTCVDPLGRPYMKVPLPADLAPGQHASVNLDFLNPQRARIKYRTAVFAGAGTL